MSALGVGDEPGRYYLITMRSNDQFNTTIYGFSDRLRGLEGSRMILLINPSDMIRVGLMEGDEVSLIGDTGDNVHREVAGPTATPFDLPDGCVGGYYPEMNVLVPLWYHDRVSKTPASKGVPVRIAQGARRGR
jgi:anaerobic selenocysteine-containing dehydrogenase